MKTTYKLILLSITAIVIAFVIIMLYFSPTSTDTGMVTVYVFEAGGCPYCEKEIEYLKSLDGYNSTFKIVTKELYIDHVNWEHGADYDLAVNVEATFHQYGFDGLTATATPMVVIGNVYANTGYNEQLSSIINQVYLNGENDVVKCVEEGGSDCYNVRARTRSNTAVRVIEIILVASLIIFGGIFIIDINKSKKQLG